MAYFARYMLDEHGNMRKVVINAGVGFCLPFYGETAPPGALACDGSEISREAYKELFAILGTKAGAGDGVNTFNLPDFRGDFIRGLGGDNAGELGVEQYDAIRNITGSIHTEEGHTLTWVGNPYAQAEGAFSITFENNNGSPTPGTGIQRLDSLDFDASRVVPTAPENRPVNVALLWCIIYE